MSRDHDVKALPEKSRFPSVFVLWAYPGCADNVYGGRANGKAFGATSFESLAFRICCLKQESVSHCIISDMLTEYQIRGNTIQNLNMAHQCPNVIRCPLKHTSRRKLICDFYISEVVMCYTECHLVGAHLKKIQLYVIWFYVMALCVLHWVLCVTMALSTY